MKPFPRVAARKQLHGGLLTTKTAPAPRSHFFPPWIPAVSRVYQRARKIVGRDSELKRVYLPWEGTRA